MKTIKGDILNPPEGTDAICIPTNGIVRANGELVMGAGLALAAKKKWPEIARTLGVAVKRFGNGVHLMNTFQSKGQEVSKNEFCYVLSFPTKNHWRDKSSLELITKSCEQLLAFVDKWGVKQVMLPVVGCGLGNLKWEEVEPILDKYLDDRFTVVFKK